MYTVSEFGQLALIGLVILTLARTGIFVVLSTLHYRQSRKLQELSKTYPSVSIIVPCYQEELTLPNCLSSLFWQIYADFEIIVVDDGSTDGTAAIGKYAARQYPDVIRFFRKKKTEAKRARSIMASLGHAAISSSLL